MTIERRKFLSVKEWTTTNNRELTQGDDVDYETLSTSIISRYCNNPAVNPDSSAWKSV